MATRPVLGHSDWDDNPDGRYTRRCALLQASISMIETIKNWLKDRFSNKAATPQDMRETSHVQVTRPRPPKKKAPEDNPEVVEVNPEMHGHIESLGPGKNVLIRNRLVREETSTKETLKILDDSMIDSGEEPGLDPYNTGSFDRSKKWDQRFRK